MSDVQQIEVNIEFAKKCIKEMNDIDALYKNAAFKRIITEGYFKDNAAKLVQRKAMPGMADQENQMAIENGFVGIGELQQYLFTKRMTGKQFEADLEDMHKTRDELAQEEAESEE
jgi:hypothetical protein